MKKSFFSLLALAAVAVLFSACFKDSDDTTTTGGSSSGGNSININDRLWAHYSFDSENGRDETDYGRDGNFPNDARFVDGITGRGVLLNGTSNTYFQIPYNFFNGRTAWSVSFWVKDLTEGCVFAAQNTNQNGDYYDAPVLWANAAGKLAVKLANGNMSYDAGTAIAYNYSNTASQWRHIVIVADLSNDPGSVKCYVDGSLVDNVTTSVSTYNINNCTRIVFGGNKGGEYNVASTFYLDEVRFYSRALTRDEAKALYNYDL